MGMADDPVGGMFSMENIWDRVCAWMPCLLPGGVKMLHVAFVACQCKPVHLRRFLAQVPRH